MFRKLIIATAALSLAACTYSAKEQHDDLVSLNETLGKEGCTVKYGGPIRVEGDRHMSKVFFTVCKATNTATLTSNKEVTEGKNYTRMDHDVSVDTDFK